MKLSTVLSLFISIFNIIIFQNAIAFDLTVVGNIAHADGLGRISIGVIDMLKDDLEINCICPKIDFTNVSEEVQSLVLNPDKTPGNVSILFNPIWYHGHDNFKNTPESPIKIAYSMLESTKIPPEWVLVLNKHFDAVVVPDHFLIEVYQNCGVTIPIFELPIGMYLKDFFQRPSRQSHPSTPFVFGSTVSCDERKNYSLLIQSFAEEFGNSKNVILKLNTKRGFVDFYKELIESLNISNIIFNNNLLNQSEYVDFIDSFDCFINISKGEGFSLCPREALALGIPCILSRNSAQITLCDTGLVKEVPSLIPEPAFYFGMFGNKKTGNFFTCEKEDVKLALRDVYTNYNFYLKKAEPGPIWVSQYLWDNLKKKYLNLIKPKKILFGKKNKITNNFFMTNSRRLYKKYTKTFSNASIPVLEKKFRSSE